MKIEDKQQMVTYLIIKLDDYDRAVLDDEIMDLLKDAEAGEHPLLREIFSRL